MHTILIHLHPVNSDNLYCLIGVKQIVRIFLKLQLGYKSLKLILHDLALIQMPVRPQ